MHKRSCRFWRSELNLQVCLVEEGNWFLKVTSNHHAPHMCTETVSSTCYFKREKEMFKYIMDKTECSIVFIQLIQHYNLSSMFLLAIAILKWKAESLQNVTWITWCTQRKQPETSTEVPGDWTGEQAWVQSPAGKPELLNLTAVWPAATTRKHNVDKDHKVTCLSTEHLWLQGPMGFSHTNMKFPRLHFPPNVGHSVHKSIFPLWLHFKTANVTQCLRYWIMRHEEIHREWLHSSQVQCQHGWTGSVPFWEGIKNSRRNQSPSSQRQHTWCAVCPGSCSAHSSWSSRA